MKINDIFRIPALLAATALLAYAGLTACSDDDDSDAVGDPYFYLEGAEDGIVHMAVTGQAADSWTFGGGDHYMVRSNCRWQIVPADGGEMPDWLKIYPMEGNGEGILRFYVVSNPMAQVRPLVLDVVINGGTAATQRLTVAQDAAGPTLTLTADLLQLQQAGSFNEVYVTANYDWAVDPVADTWLSVARDDNKLTIGTSEPNTTGAERTATVVLRGTGENSAVVTPITVTQLDAVFFDDFSWAFSPIEGTTEPDKSQTVCWGGTILRIDKWIDEIKVGNPGWTAVRGVNATTNGPYTYCRYQYLQFGTSAKNAGNICAPAIPSIEGSVNANISWSMAGFTSKTNKRDDGSEFWVTILGPGRITAASSSGNSTAAVATGECTIPYNSTGDTPLTDVGTYDIDLTEAAKFTVGADGYFDTDEPTGLEVWKSDDTKFSIKVEGMTAQTRIVFIGCDADRVKMTSGTGWELAAGSSRYKSNRLLFDNYKVVVE